VVHLLIATLLSVLAATSAFAQANRPPERTRVLALEPGITATIVALETLDLRQPVDLILYALPNGNSTAETMGRPVTDSIGWRYDIQHIAAQTRALRGRGYPQAVVVYLEAEGKSWPAWRAKLGYPVANARIVKLVDELRVAIGSPSQLSVTLTGHSGGGSFAFGFIDGQDKLPDWLSRIAFLDSNYNFEPRHGDKLLEWLNASAGHRLVVLAYDDRNIMLDGKKVVSDSGGTWRATERMIQRLSLSVAFTHDTLGAFLRARSSQIELLRHPNPLNRILHTEMIGEMNGYMHALLSGRSGYGDAQSVLRPVREYTRYVELSPP
jgi:hypothetical protein